MTFRGSKLREEGWKESLKGLWPETAKSLRKLHWLASSACTKTLRCKTQPNPAATAARQASGCIESRCQGGIPGSAPVFLELHLAATRGLLELSRKSLLKCRLLCQLSCHELGKGGGFQCCCKVIWFPARLTSGWSAGEGAAFYRIPQWPSLESSSSSPF